MINKNVMLVAELSANHGGRLESAKETLLTFKKAGADAVKLQTYTADSLTIDIRQEPFIIDQGTLWDGRSLYNLYTEAAMPMHWHEELFKFGREIGLIVFSSPFSPGDADYLRQYNPPIYKIASFEITDIPLIRYVASFGKPIIISTGIATIDEIQSAIDCCREQGVNDITLLQCVSEYPASPDQANLNMIPNLAQTFGVKSGLSDHSVGPELAVAAVALGAVVVEKHVILDRNMGGPDAAFSMEPNEFSEMVRMVRNVELGLGKIDYSLTQRKQKSRNFSRSLFIVEDVKMGDVVSSENIRSIRPGSGMAPRYYDDVIGQLFNADYKKGTPLKWGNLKEV